MIRTSTAAAWMLVSALLGFATGLFVLAPPAPKERVIGGGTESELVLHGTIPTPG